MTQQMNLRMRLRKTFSFNFVLIACAILSDERPADVKQCPDYLVYIKEINDCQPKIRLDHECDYKQQCLAKTKHSYCGSNVDDEHHQDGRSTKICLCNDGYHSGIDNGEKCLPNRPCNYSGFNEQKKQFDCGKNQFCRHNICLCSSKNYEFNQNEDGSYYCKYLHNICFWNEQILISPIVGCVNKAKIGQLCEYTEQCLALANNSICAIQTKTNASICQCESGHVYNGKTCVQIVTTTVESTETTVQVDNQTNLTLTEFNSTSNSILLSKDEIPKSVLREKEGIRLDKPFDFDSWLYKSFEIHQNTFYLIVLILLMIAGIGILVTLMYKRGLYSFWTSEDSINSFELVRTPERLAQPRPEEEERFL